MRKIGWRTVADRLAATAFLAGVALVVSGVVSMTDFVRAQEASPSAEDEHKVRQCLDAVGKAGSDPRACVGVVADACLDGAGEAGAEVSIACIDRERHIWGQLLEDRHETVKSRLDEVGAERLVSIHEAWLAFREQRCAFGDVLFSGEEGASLWRADCLLEETGRRAIELGAMQDELAGR